ncbi:MAG: ABC transporter ATP-binding protein [Alphaproteobacteria bacterium]|nr:ABC transporter ATP-binding protein [Alphaproteobacteria bacterium]
MSSTRPVEAPDLLAISNLSLGFSTLDGPVRVLRGIDLTVRAQEKVALVGESGSGKSVTARAIMGLLPERRTMASGSIRFAGRELLGRPAEAEALRGREISMIFQDPTASLNPFFSIRQQFRTVIARGGARHSAEAAEQRMRQALRDVSIPDPERVLGSYSFQLSGGLNQRVMIAMALVNTPKLLIADEPGTALDVTVQEQTLRMMRRLSQQNGTAILFISHNLGVVRQFADRVYVMYAGALVEEGPVQRIFTAPLHPYTRALLASVPRLARPTIPTGIEGSLPDRLKPIQGCAFRPRCSLSISACASEVALVAGAEGHRAACVHVVPPA